MENRVIEAGVRNADHDIFALSHRLALRSLHLATRQGAVEVANIFHDRDNCEAAGVGLRIWASGKMGGM